MDLEIVNDGERGLIARDRETGEEVPVPIDELDVKSTYSESVNTDRAAIANLPPEVSISIEGDEYVATSRRSGELERNTDLNQVIDPAFAEIDAQGGGRLHFAAGEYLINGMVTGCSDVMVTGEGYATKVQVEAGAQALAYIFYWEDEDNITFQNMRLVGKDDTGHMVYYEGCQNTITTGCWFEDCTAEPLRINQASGERLSQNHLVANNTLLDYSSENSVQGGIEAIGTDIRIVGNEFDAGGTVADYVVSGVNISGESITVADNTIRSVDEGVRLVGKNDYPDGDNVKVNDNTIVDVKDVGVAVGDSSSAPTNVSVSDNTIRGADSGADSSMQGVVDQSASCAITDNIIEGFNDSTGEAVRTLGADTTVSGNQVRDCPDGIFLNSAAVTPVARNNSVDASGGNRGIVSDADDAVIENNDVEGAAIGIRANADSNRVKGNDVIDCGSYGVQVASGTGNVVKFNYFENNGTNVSDSGTDTTTAYNERFAAFNGTGDGMTADPETSAEDGYVTIIYNGTEYQVPMYLA